MLAVLLLLAADPLHARLDALIPGTPSAPADDAAFLRRAWLDLAGTGPTAAEARAFLDDKDAGKRAKLIDRLLAGPGYAARMADLFHVHLMERLGDSPEWSKYLHDSFAKNRPWDEMARHMLDPRPEGDAAATFWVTKRLENYGQQEVDKPGLARDIGRLFLGRDFRCAQCHDHLFIDEYKQAHFQGLFAFVQNAALLNQKTLIETPTGGRLAFQSVFGKGKGETGPRLPGGKEVAVPALEKGKEWLTPPDRKTRAPGVPRFSPLTELARELPAHPDFSRNVVNRLWWAFLGRGLVHPLDLHHKDNPPSHPALLDLLAKEFVAHKHDVRWLVREVVLTKAYQRSSELPDGVTALKPERFLTAIERRLTPEQVMRATLAATGTALAGKDLDAARAKFTKAFAGPAREPEEEPAPSLKSALFLLNDPLLLGWLRPNPGNLTARLVAMKDDEAAQELYLSVLTRRPDAEERAAVLKALAGPDRERAVVRLAWALLASTEFHVNH
ncbi:MAG: DUF1549 domain-containing protein [Gemmataceae bacterium]